MPNHSPADTTSDVRQLLTRVFGAIDARALEAVEGELTPIHTPGGSVLFEQGDPGDSMYLLLHGRLHVGIRNTETGVDDLLGEILPGEAVGEIGLITGEARTATLSATRDSLLVRIGRDAFDRMAAIDPNLLRTLANIVVGRLRDRGAHHRFRPRVSNITLLPLSSSAEIDGFAASLCTNLGRFGRTRRLGHADFLAVQRGAGDDSEQLTAWLARNEADHRFVVYDAGPAENSWHQLCLRQSDVVVTVAQADSDPAELLGLTGAGEKESSEHAVRQVLVLLHKGNDPEIKGTSQWLDGRPFDEHYHVRIEHTEDIERLARILAGQGVGLVLGGGGARGFAHVGVYRALYERGIRVDWVGGTSIGSVFAATMAMGWDPDRVEEVARKAFIEGRPMSGLTLPLVSLLSGKRLDKLVVDYFDQSIEDLPVPYFCIATNLSDASVMVQERGNLARAVRASVALPGVFPPAVFGDDLIIDGGVLNNLPADVMAERPVGKIIAVSLSGRKDYTLTYKKIPSAWRILLSKLPFMKRIRVPGIAILMMKATEVASLVHARSAQNDADLVLNPPVRNFGLLDTSAFDDLVKVGYDHAIERLKNWRG